MTTLMPSWQRSLESAMDRFQCWSTPLILTPPCRLASRPPCIQSNDPAMQMQQWPSLVNEKAKRLMIMPGPRIEIRKGVSFREPQQWGLTMLPGRFYFNDAFTSSILFKTPWTSRTSCRRMDLALSSPPVSTSSSFRITCCMTVSEILR